MGGGGGGGWGGVFSRIAGLGEGGGSLGGQGSELSRDPTTTNAVAFPPQRGELLVGEAGPKHRRDSSVATDKAWLTTSSSSGDVWKNVLNFESRATYFSIVINWLFTSFSTVWEVLIELVHSTLEELRDWY